MYTFWLQHADAVGVAVILIVTTLIGWLWLSARHDDELRAQRRKFATERRSYLARIDALRALLAHAATKARPGYEETVTGALALTEPVRTPITDAYALERTVADVPSPYAPVWGEA